MEHDPACVNMTNYHRLLAQEQEPQKGTNLKKQHIGKTKRLVQDLQHFSKDEMLSRKSQTEHGKETGAFQKTCQVFRQNPLYQIEGNV